MRVVTSIFALCVAPTVAFASGEVRVFTFEGYADAEWTEPFEEATGCSVNITFTGSVDEMFARMVASDGEEFDVISIDTSLFPLYRKRGLLSEYDQSKLSNLANLLPAFQDLPELRDGDELFGVPITWGSLGLIYDREVFDEAPNSWQVLWDPETASQAIVLNDANNNIVQSAIVLGLDDPFNLTDEEFAKVRDHLVEQRDSIMAYYNGFEEGAAVWESAGASLMFSMGESQAGSLRDRGFDVGYVIPDEGGIGWLDTWALSSGVADAECAHQWVNMFLDGSTGPAITAAHGYGNTTQASETLDYADRLIWLQPVESQERRNEVWSEIRAAQ